jgi:hypothetical protein
MTLKDGAWVAEIRTGRAPLLLLPLCLILAGCLSGLATQKTKAFSTNPTPPDSAVYCCAVKAVFGDEECITRPVVPQPAWDRAVKDCEEVACRERPQE